ncbi:MAG: DUF3576 domain-containing protein [Pelagibacteraceae bacterium]|jgi:hypothetical protein|nr:DUF3576 domain-containing protein [Pelagibacteraceae bacterium]MBT4646563.1 DUF3576 domain-containing protein [Pelagibacteraceae bacterium]MBT4951255.1 DUF3576 domain-containing protein [Pelagibacteraceae bacterium]MBT5212938.1 DUF3576 domain-containing protein [Pelagibacteraceae bacterium]MBT6355291.1 DUF3576 domain-containing protein [Pelagibacteraceae bacterium]
MLKSYLFLIIFMLLLIGCNKNLTEEEKKAMWDKAQTRGEIINRSGTPFNLATDPDLAMSDAKNRLRTGGGLLGKKANFNFLGEDDGSSSQTSTIGMPINAYLWKASIETINFMPLSSTDPFAGTIITDWYTTETNLNERCKLNVFINGQELKTENLKVSSFCQSLKNNQWVNMPSSSENNIRLENAILNKAKKLKLTSG